MNTMRMLTAGLALMVLFGARAEWEPIESPAGPGSLAPGLAVMEDGKAVLSWLEPHAGGHVLHFSVFDGTGFAGSGEVARGKDWFANWADTPAIFVLPDGDWIAHWLVKSGPATFAYDVTFARSSDQGRSWTEPVVPHRDGTQTEHGFVSYFAWNETTAGMVWLDGRETVGAGNGDHDHHGHHGDMTLRAARIGPDTGVSDKALLDSRVCDCCQTAAAVTDSGPVVAYRGRSEDEIRDILIVRHAGGEWTDPVAVHDDGWQIGGCPVNGPDIAARGEEVVVAWFTISDGEPQVRVARSSDAGGTFELTAELGKGSALGRVALVPLSSGHALVWMDQPGTEARLMLTLLSTNGQALSTRELISLDGGRASGFPQAVFLGENQGLLLAWTESTAERERRVRAGLIRLP